MILCRACVPLCGGCGRLAGVRETGVLGWRGVSAGGPPGGGAVRLGLGRTLQHVCDQLTEASIPNPGSETVCRMEPSTERTVGPVAAELAAAAGPALPGTLTVRSYACGKRRCRCHDDPSAEPLSA